MLHVFVRNTAAIHFYEKLGYSRLGINHGFYGGAIDAAMYWKEL
jgi:ribosomal protein S18 acetylase RimI-like enzyme